MLTSSFSSSCWIASRHDGRWFALVSPAGRCVLSNPSFQSWRSIFKPITAVESRSGIQAVSLKTGRTFPLRGPGELVRLVAVVQSTRMLSTGSTYGCYKTTWSTVGGLWWRTSQLSCRDESHNQLKWKPELNSMTQAYVSIKQILMLTSCVFNLL